MVVTLDLDFADIRAYPPADHAGIIVFRLTLLDKFHVLSVLQRLLPVLEHEPLAGKLWIVDETSVACVADGSILHLRIAARKSAFASSRKSTR